ncbi:hypothetical protein TCDM_04318 [Trypanosoma cruzi Dm28c]|uniref:Asparagine synthase n=1 Tax=Trypanosoma cruzi Dm28c TaxID=1416333 RepID=V5BRB0_TRYCR|nr:hypothetical protein TCDM_04318 [Trypanosoma cruzi Dm28c]
MCGICCTLLLHGRRGLQDLVVCNEGVVERAALHQSLRRRGPDAFESLQLEIAPGVRVEAASAVLCLRGVGGGGAVVAEGCSGKNQGIPQPAMAARDCFCSHAPSCLSFLEWNGEVFGGALHLSPGVSDTTVVLDRLHQLEHGFTAELCDGTNGADGVCGAAALATAQASFAEACVHFFETEIEGPYAFVYYAHSLQLFLFGRDPLGRRSLLLHVASAFPEKGEGGENGASENHSVEVTISSVAEGHFDASCMVVKSAGRGNKRRRCECRGQSDVSDENNHSDDDRAESFVDFPSSGCSCWQEIPNTGLFAISVAVPQQNSLVSHHPWTVDHGIHPLLRFQSWPQSSSATGRLRMKDEETAEDEYPAIIRCLLRESGKPSLTSLKDFLDFDLKMAARYLNALWRAVEVRVKAENCGDDPTRPIGVLFSGGIDCTVLTAIAHYVLPVTTPIELINVAFGDVPELAPDRVATFRAFEQLLRLPTRLKEDNHEIFCANGREWRLVLVDVPHNANLSHVQSLVCPGSSVIDMSIGTALWHAAQGCGRVQRVRAEEELVSRMRSKNSLCGRHKFYRVSTEEKKPCELEVIIPTCGDATAETKFVPLIEAIISELEAFNEEPSSPVLLSTLGKDHRTTLRPVLTKYGYKKLGPYLNDASAAGLIAFARRDEAPSKAVRLVRPADMGKVQRVVPAKWLVSDCDFSPLGSCADNYTCEARVLLLGMGADETLGGYTRHRRAFERHGAKGLVEELGRDFARLWKRNLGRDDRVVCDSGREGRYPYLDEGVLATLASIAAEAYRCAIDTTHRTTAIAVDEDRALQEALAPACCFTSEDGAPGVGDKKILRQCASMLGLGDVVRLQKRAIQFGSRVAQAPS